MFVEFFKLSTGFSFEIILTIFKNNYPTDTEEFILLNFTILSEIPIVY